MIIMFTAVMPRVLVIVAMMIMVVVIITGLDDASRGEHHRSHQKNALNRSSYSVHASSPLM
jgi:hypothetical protein